MVKTSFTKMTDAIEAFAKQEDCTYVLTIRFKDNGIIQVSKGKVDARGKPVRRFPG